MSSSRRVIRRNTWGGVGGVERKARGEGREGGGFIRHPFGRQNSPFTTFINSTCTSDVQRLWGSATPLRMGGSGTGERGWVKLDTSSVTHLPVVVLSGRYEIRERQPSAWVQIGPFPHVLARYPMASPRREGFPPTSCMKPKKKKNGVPPPLPTLPPCFRSSGTDDPPRPFQ